MQIKTKAIILSSTEKAYNFQGKSGVSYKATFLVEGQDKTFAVKITPEQYAELKDLKAKEGDLTLDIKVFDNALIASLNTFDWVE